MEERLLKISCILQFDHEEKRLEDALGVTNETVQKLLFKHLKLGPPSLIMENVLLDQEYSIPEKMMAIFYFGKLKGEKDMFAAMTDADNYMKIKVPSELKAMLQSVFKQAKEEKNYG